MSSRAVHESEYENSRKNRGGSTNNNSDEISLSIEETNALREKLGLPPLKIDNNNKNSQDKEKKNQEDEETMRAQKAQEIRERIKNTKEKRRIAERLSGPSLGELLKSDDFGAAAWFEKTKDLKKVAQRLDQEFDEMDGQTSNQEKKKQYSSKELSDVVVGHDLKEVLENADNEMVLTLRDEPILRQEKGDYELNEADTILENTNLIEKEKTAEYNERRKKKPLYDAFSEKKDILSRYDEPEEKPAFVIGEGELLH